MKKQILYLHWGGIDFSVPNYWTYIDDPDFEGEGYSFYTEFNEETEDMTFIMFMEAEYNKEKYASDEALETLIMGSKEDYNIINESNLRRNPHDVPIKWISCQLVDHPIDLYYIANPDKGAIVMLSFFQSDLSEYDYTNDVQKIIDSASIKK